MPILFLVVFFVSTKVSTVTEASLSVDTTATLVGRLDVLLNSSQQRALYQRGILRKELRGVIGRTNFVFFAVCVTSDDIEPTQSIGELLSIDVDTFVPTHVGVVHTAVVEDVDHVWLDIVSRNSQGSGSVLHVEYCISTDPIKATRNSQTWEL